MRNRQGTAQSAAELILTKGWIHRRIAARGRIHRFLVLARRLHPVTLDRLIGRAVQFVGSRLDVHVDLRGALPILRPVHAIHHLEFLNRELVGDIDGHAEEEVRVGDAVHAVAGRLRLRAVRAHFHVFLVDPVVAPIHARAAGRNVGAHVGDHQVGEVAAVHREGIDQVGLNHLADGLILRVQHLGVGCHLHGIAHATDHELEVLAQCLLHLQNQVS